MNLKPGQYIRHSKYGCGTIVTRDSERTTVDFDTAGMKKRVSPEECVGVERASVWDDHHIEERLLDHFMGRPNRDEIRSRVHLKPW